MSLAAAVELLGLLLALATQLPQAVDAVGQVIKHIEALLDGTEMPIEDRSVLLAKIRTAQAMLPKPASTGGAA